MKKISAQVDDLEKTVRVMSAKIEDLEYKKYK